MFEYFKSLFDPVNTKTKILTSFCDNNTKKAITPGREDNDKFCYVGGTQCPIYDYAQLGKKDSARRVCDFESERYDTCDIDITYYLLIEFLSKKRS